MNNMKKILALIAAAILMASCDSGLKQSIPIRSGDIRVTVTDEHFVIEKLHFTGAFGDHYWDLVLITDRDSTSTEAVCNMIKAVRTQKDE